MMTPNLLKDFRKAVSSNRTDEIARLGFTILASPIPYPQTLCEYVYTHLKHSIPGLVLAEPTTDISSEDADSIQLIENYGWTFDLVYYSIDVKTAFRSRRDAIHHYIRSGWRKGHDPVRFFKTKFYLGYEDIAASGMCPLIHYIKHGIKELRKTADPFHAMYRAADLTKIDPLPDEITEDVKIGVFLHLYYTELAEQIIPYLNNIPYPYDLYISAREHSVPGLAEIFQAKCRLCMNVNIESFPNIGRDVAPFLCGFGRYIGDYQLVLKLHSKKSPHESQLSNWLEHILDNLLGSTEIVSTIIHHLLFKDATIIFPVETLEIMLAIAKDSSWGHNPRNFELAQSILDQWNIQVDQNDSFTFPAGTMFWSHSNALAPLVDLNLSFADFDREEGQIDGTLAHSLERLIGISASRLLKGTLKTSFLSWNVGQKGKDRVNHLISSYPIHASGFEKVYPFSKRELDKTLLRPSLDKQSLDIHWVIPNFNPGAGGHMTIFRAVEYMEKMGHTCTLWIHSLREGNQGSIPSIYHRVLIQSHFLSIQARVFLLGGSPECVDMISGDVVIATDRMSVYPVLAMPNFLARAYFVQDYEPGFFAVGSESYLTEQTYAAENGFLCICASPWLYQLMRNKYGNQSVSFSLAVDHDIYKPCLPGTKNFGQIAFYVRRSTPRRLFAIGLLALHELFVSGASFSVVVFGEENTPDLKLPVPTEYRGVLSGHELREVYAHSYVGIVLSGTNYSLIPNEMMAVGLPVVDIDAEHTRISYQEGTVLLSEPDPKSIAKNLKSLLDDQDLWKKHFHAGLKAAQSLSWQTSFQPVHSALIDLCSHAYDSYPAKAPLQVASPRVTVAIPAYNGGPQLQQCLQTILRQYTSFDFEVLVIDSSSTDGSIKAITGLPRTRVVTIKKTDFGHGKTRNMAAQLALGEFVAFLTQDAIPANRFWLENLVKPMLDDKDVAGVFGAHISHPSHSPLIAVDMENHFYHWLAANHSSSIRRSLADPGIETKDHERFYSDNNSCLRKSVWKNIPYPDVVFGEDQLWAELILKAGYKKAFAPMAIVQHSHEYGFRDELLRANTEWHFFNEYFGRQLPHEKKDVFAMIQHNIRQDEVAAGNLGLSIERRAKHLARGAGFYLAGKGYGEIRP